MAKLLYWIRNRVERAGEEPHAGEVDTYVVQLVRQGALLRAQAEQ